MLHRDMRRLVTNNIGVLDLAFLHIQHDDTKVHSQISYMPMHIYTIDNLGESGLLEIQIGDILYLILGCNHIQLTILIAQQQAIEGRIIRHRRNDGTIQTSQTVVVIDLLGLPVHRKQRMAGQSKHLIARHGYSIYSRKSRVDIPLVHATVHPIIFGGINMYVGQQTICQRK